MLVAASALKPDAASAPLSIDAPDTVRRVSLTVYAARGQDTTALLTATSNATGVIPEALAFVHFFDNHYDKVILRPAASQ